MVGFIAYITRGDVLPFTTYLMMVGGWYLFAVVATADGYWHELTGGKAHEYHKHTHRLMWQLHTGLPLDPKKSHGEEKRLSRTAARTSNATPEGQMVYWSKWPRWVKAVRNNLLVLGFWAFLNGLIWAPEQAITGLSVMLFLVPLWLTWKLIRRIRKHVALRQPKEVKTRKLATTADLVKVGAGGMDGDVNSPMYVAGGTVVEEKPSLTGGVPQKVMSLLLSGALQVSTDEAATLLELTPDKGHLKLPDRFPALQSQRDTIEEIVRAQSAAAALRFRWHTSAVPRYVDWVPVVNTLPGRALFRDHLKEIEALPRGEFGVGLTMERDMYIASHNGDTPWWMKSMDSGTGKSVSFLIKAAQILHKDPMADLYCWDTKQVSFLPLHGIPGVTIYDDPVTGMGQMWNGWYDLKDILTERYTMWRTGQARKEDFNDIWVLVDEGNDLGAQFKTFYDVNMRGKNGPATVPIWNECVAKVLYQGREVGIRGEMLFQNITDKALGGVSLKDAFQRKGMAGYSKAQWERIIGTKFQPLRTGPGKIMMVAGRDERWVQAFYDDPDWLRAYAMAGRESRAA